MVHSEARRKDQVSLAERSAQLLDARWRCKRAVEKSRKSERLSLVDVEAAALPLLAAVQAELLHCGIGEQLKRTQRKELHDWHVAAITAVLEVGTETLLRKLESRAAGGGQRFAFCYGKQFRPYPDDLRQALWARLDSAGEYSEDELPEWHMAVEGDGCGVVYACSRGGSTARKYCDHCRRNLTSVIQRRWSRVRNAELGGGIWADDGGKTIWLRVCQCGDVFRTTTVQQWVCDRHSRSHRGHRGRRPTFEDVRISLSKR
jgi:hypothetical protein